MTAVSIHAPTRGATITDDKLQKAPAGFNPRAHAGRDSVDLDRLDEIIAFQSTRPRGARPRRPSLI